MFFASDNDDERQCWYDNDVCGKPDSRAGDEYEVEHVILHTDGLTGLWCNILEFIQGGRVFSRRLRVLDALWPRATHTVCANHYLQEKFGLVTEKARLDEDSEGVPWYVPWDIAVDDASELHRSEDGELVNVPQGFIETRTPYLISGQPVEPQSEASNVAEALEHWRQRYEDDA